ncbi:exonuclease domain-containing protein [Candidatus Marinamargulisbacteria bacterium]|nr:exonuclease domain-containing protein [Candidatus Marinamargulisbacteria bacterium]
MFIFYDFETSSRSLLGQILSYAFVVVDSNYSVCDHLVGTIALNRTQLPDIGAILTNRIYLEEHQSQSPSEKVSAERIYAFLDRWTSRSVCTLVGYNSNQFDLNFLRNLLIRYGYNPYYYGRLKNKDLLHYSRHLALNYPDQFQWELGVNRQNAPYWMFTLESMAMRYGVLSDKQTHDALADVHVCLDLISVLESEFPCETLTGFQPFSTSSSSVGQLVQSRVVGNPPMRCQDRIFYVVAMDRRAVIISDLDRYKPNDGLSEMTNYGLRYQNPNKHYLQLAPIQSAPESYQNSYLSIQKNPTIQSLSVDTYLASLNNDWDIEHRIYAMGFERITQLHQLIQTVDKTPTAHTALVNDLMQEPSDKNLQLVQLFNRYYLNYASEVPESYFKRYLIPRYITGEYERDLEGFQAFPLRYAELLEHLKQPNPDDIEILHDLKAYYDCFKERYPYLTQTTTK